RGTARGGGLGRTRRRAAGARLPGRRERRVRFGRVRGRDGGGVRAARHRGQQRRGLDAPAVPRHVGRFVRARVPLQRDDRVRAHEGGDTAPARRRSRRGGEHLVGDVAATRPRV